MSYDRRFSIKILNNTVYFCVSWFMNMYNTLEPLEKQDGALFQCNPQFTTTIKFFSVKHTVYPEFAELRFDDLKPITHSCPPHAVCSCQIVAHPSFFTQSLKTAEWVLG